MRILILGSGLMGPAAAFNAASDPHVSTVGICDKSQVQLDACISVLAGKDGAEKITTILLDLTDEAATIELLKDFDVAVSALPRPVNTLAIRAALRAQMPLVDLTRPDQDQLPELEREAAGTRGLVILGCGVEPGLTEIMARHLAEKLDRVDELHIKCGGIPEKPSPPLGYKIVFGGQHMPLRDGDAYMVQDGKLGAVARYSGVESVVFQGVGECEAWHEGFMPWLLDLPSLRGLRVGTQKTVRWPGYAEKVTVLKEMGLLSQDPVEVDGVKIAPKRLLDAVLFPRVKMDAVDRDITVFCVEATGEKAGRRRVYKIEMVDRFDEVLGFTSMARTTSFTGATVARMIAGGEFAGAAGLVPPEKVINGDLFDRLVSELASVGIRFDLLMEKVEGLDGTKKR